MAIEAFCKARPEHAEAIAHLVNLAYRPAAGHGGWTHESQLVSGDRVNPAQICDMIAQPGAVILLGWQAEQIIACMLVEAQGSSAYLGMLAVHPAAQQAGLGKLMLAEAERHARLSLRCDKYVMSVLSVRSELLAYYLRRGYRRTGERQAYPLTAGVGTPLQDGIDLEVLEKPALDTH